MWFGYMCNLIMCMLGYCYFVTARSTVSIINISRLQETVSIVWNDVPAATLKANNLVAINI